MELRLRVVGVVSLLSLIPATSLGASISIQTQPVGSPGNLSDPATGNGAVAYNYRMGTFDVTNTQYAAFLNAKASASDPNGLWDPAMDPTINTSPGGIMRNNAGGGGFTYTVTPGRENEPAVYVSWLDALRFANWMTNGQGTGDTESGTYVITNGGATVSVPDAAQRAAWAASGSVHWLVPSHDEWYKAAYYNAQNGTYYAYPFQSNSQPAALAPPGNANSGNFNEVNTQSGGDLLTNVGAYLNSVSPFGSYDMGGDLAQWTDTAGAPGTRYALGSDSSDGPNESASTFALEAGQTGNSIAIGFRVDVVPEPASLVLATICLGMTAILFRRRGTA